MKCAARGLLKIQDPKIARKLPSGPHRTTLSRYVFAAKASMYSLTSRVRVTTPPQYGRHGTAHTAVASILSPAKGVFTSMRSVRVRHACGVRWARRITAGLCHAFP